MTIPNRNEVQRAVARSKCSALVRKFPRVDWILDDESYFTLSHSTINGNNNFYSSDVSLTPESEKFTKKSKHEPKLLVWVAMSPAGLSLPFIQPAGMAITSKLYVDKCLRPKLLPFIEAHHADGNYAFWPDLASSHYADNTLDFLLENGINHVDKNDNPANLPEVRPIEDFWSLLKGEVYKNGWKASNLTQLRKKILKCLKNFDDTSLQRLSSATSKRLEIVRRLDIVENRQ